MVSHMHEVHDLTKCQILDCPYFVGNLKHHISVVHGSIPVVTTSVEGHTNEIVVQAQEIDLNPPAIQNIEMMDEDIPTSDIPTSDIALPGTSQESQIGATNKTIRLLQKVQPTDKLM